MITIVTKTIPKSELRGYKDYINYLFLNENGVYNICKTEEDVMKSNQWFKNLPLETFVISDEKIKEGDKFLAFATNRDLNGKIFTYVGKNKEGVDLIDLIGPAGEEVISTIHLLDGAKRFEREATMDDKQTIVKNQGNIVRLLEV